MATPSRFKVIMRKITPFFGIILIAGFFGFVYLMGLSDIENAKAGDCTVYDAGNRNDPYKLANCDDAKSKYKIYSIADSGKSSDCIDVPGVTRTVSFKGKVACMGDKNIDISRAINGTKEGDCLSVSGSLASKLPCSDPEAKYVVLKALGSTGKTFLTASCKDTDFTLAYGWGIEQQNSQIRSLAYDRAYCLGPNRAS